MEYFLIDGYHCFPVWVINNKKWRTRQQYSLSSPTNQKWLNQEHLFVFLPVKLCFESFPVPVTSSYSTFLFLCVLKLPSPLLTQYLELLTTLLETLRSFMVILQRQSVNTWKFLCQITHMCLCAFLCGGICQILKAVPLVLGYFIHCWSLIHTSLCLTATSLPFLSKIF